MLTAFNIPPGLSRQGTLYQTKNRWYSGAYTRWYEGSHFPIGAWVARTTSPVTGKPRAILTMEADDNTRFIIVGTESHLYALTPSLVAPVDITPAGFTSGHADAATGGGYGAGKYGSGTYGTPRVDSIGIAYEAAMWELDTFGGTPVMCMADDGKIYQWGRDISTPTRAAVIAGAPTGNQGIVVTPEGFLFALGANGARRTVAWCDRGDFTTWTPTATNEAGDYDIQSQGGLMCGARTRAQTLLHTNLDLHLATYLGLPNVYQIDRVGENCGAISRKPGAAVLDRYFFMGRNSFHVWNGASLAEMECDVYDGVFGDFNDTQRSKVSCFAVAQFSEIWWVYPTAASSENNMAVTYNYKHNYWNLHPLARLSGADKGIYDFPIMCDSSGYLYDHENGTAWDTTPYAESGPNEDGDGDRLVKCNGIIIDERTSGDVHLYVKGKEWPTDADVTFGPYAQPNPVDARFALRSPRLRVEFQGAGQFGTPRFDLIGGGRR